MLSEATEPEDLGRELHFAVVIDAAGWFAECLEFPIIFAGDENPDPSDTELIKGIFDAIQEAFVAMQVRKET